MSVCGHRPEPAGMFTPCALALGGCRCADDLRADADPAPAAPPAHTGRHTPSPCAVAPTLARVTVRVDMNPWRQAMDRLAEAMAITFADLAPRVQAMAAQFQRLDQPGHQPRPLAIDGHAYHRRTRARRRRTR